MYYAMGASCTMNGLMLQTCCLSSGREEIGAEEQICHNTWEDAGKMDASSYGLQSTALTREQLDNSPDPWQRNDDK